MHVGERSSASSARKRAIKLKIARGIKDLVQDYSRIIRERIFISGVATYTLLDSRATNSFISETFVKRLKIIHEDLDLGFRVSSPSGMVTTKIVKNLELHLQKNAAARNKKIPHIISCICARKLMKRGWQAFLVSLMSVSELVNQRLDDFEVVRDFPGLFPEEVFSIPTDREVEFSIDSMSGTGPISKAPYHLAPTEMNELKEQI
ncbi:uncharacterized protein [Primulina huaijiensis]|uniref:uncharacterized protein n=1 Tax=Primulina huaijiensis TaxID=1492673 RepID=UPI003CC6EBA0